MSRRVTRRTEVRGILASIESETFETTDGTTAAGITIDELANLKNRDPTEMIEQINSAALAALKNAKRIIELAEKKDHANTRDDYRRTAELVRHFAGHTLGEIMWLKEARSRGDLERAVYHALRAGSFAATLDAVYSEPDASAGTRARPDPKRPNSSGQSTAQRHEKIRTEYKKIEHDKDFPKKALKVAEVARRCSCSERTVYKVLAAR